MRPAVLIPALDAADTIVRVVSGLSSHLPEGVPVIVIDDGSTDATAELAEKAGAEVLRHPKNRGKGAAIRTGLIAARAKGCDVAVTVDADGQHPPDQAVRLLDPAYDPHALVLGARELAHSGAPLANRIGNAVANFFVSVFTRRRFRDTQCGLRRYPIAETLALRTRDQRFGFEAEVIFAAIRAKMTVLEANVTVLYPPRRRTRVAASEIAYFTRYRAFRDTILITWRITATILYPVRWAVLALCLSAFLLIGQGALLRFTRMLPPDVVLPAEAARPDPRSAAIVRVGQSDYARRRGGIWEVALSGTPEQIGAHHVALLRPEMIAIEDQLWRQLDTFVPSRFARLLLFDMARLRFRGIDRAMDDRFRREIAATALAFRPDPYSDRVPSYQRMVYLHALYDVSLSFEHSPLIGCTSFAVVGQATAQGHAFLARTFDFEAGDAFDAKKAVFLVHEGGRLRYASVAWPGLIGTVTGMNEAGLALVVHGGRAREPSSVGQPLVHTMRDILGEARSTAEAVAILSARAPMVSHIVLLVDAGGDVAVVERAPGEAAVVRRGNDKTALTNHFEGPWAGDPKNVEVKNETSTLARRARADELLQRLPRTATVDDLVAMLRDKRGLGDAILPVGDRRAIDAAIATHGVVFDATARVMWVSEGPHLSGRFIEFDLRRLLAPGYNPAVDDEVIALGGSP